MSAEYPSAEWSPIPGFGFPTGSHNGNAPRWIVLHGTSSNGATAQNIASYFAGDNQNGTHFVIGKDGVVIQMVALHDAAYGNGGPTSQELAEHKYADFWQAEVDAGTNLNTVTISIEHCKDSGNAEDLTPAQQDASFKLVAWLCKTLNIPARAADASGGITGHFSINGIERVNCPGSYPWQALFSYLGGAFLDPKYQQTAPDNLLASNGHNVHGWICTNVLASLNAEHLSALIGEPQEEAHHDGDSRWRQRFDVAVASQHDSNEADFCFEPLPSTADPTLQQRLEEAVAALADAKQQLALLQQAQPADMTQLAQRAVSALETLTADVHQLQRLIPPSAPQLS